MTIQWTIIAVILYTEIALVVLLLLPILSARRWHFILSSNLVSSITAYARYYVVAFVAVLSILFLDSLRELRKYNVAHSSQDLKNNPQAMDQMRMKLFLAQRNFYISGFALLLFLILKRLSSLFSELASKDNEIADAKQANKPVQASSGGNLPDVNLDNLQNDLNKARKELSILKQENEHLQLQFKKTQSDYDALLKEHESLQTLLYEPDKKDD